MPSLFLLLNFKIMVKEYKTTAEKDKLLAKNKDQQAKYQEGNQDPKIEGDEAYNDSAAY